MKFKKITIDGWRQFSEVEIEFHPRITIITGANGAGKSTILRVLSQHFGWSITLLSTPKPTSSGIFSYFSGKFRRLRNNESTESENEVGKLTYDNDSEARLIVPENKSATYNLQISNQQNVPGLLINSHRQVQNYQPVTNISVNAISAAQAYQQYSGDIMQRFNGGHTQFSPMYRMKEAIISMATFGAGNQYVTKNPELEKLFLDFKRVLSQVLPPSVGFLDINIRIPDVVIVSKSGEFMIDAASGGLMSIIDLAWQIFLFSQNKDDFTVTIDEPENHLHPSMQRSLLSNLIKAFPKAQFIVATHSPFIVSSVKDSYVYALKYHDLNEGSETTTSRRISSMMLDLNNKAGTASEILRDVLDVPVTLPEWAEVELETIARNFIVHGMGVNTESINALRAQLDAKGLGEYYPDALKLWLVNTYDKTN